MRRNSADRLRQQLRHEYETLASDLYAVIGSGLKQEQSRNMSFAGNSIMYFKMCGNDMLMILLSTFVQLLMTPGYMDNLVSSQRRSVEHYEVGPQTSQ